MTTDDADENPMTPHPDLPDDADPALDVDPDAVAGADDELVSAVLDGEADADEIARVEGDLVLAERRRELAAVAAAVAEPVVPPAALDDLLGIALAAADEGSVTSAHGSRTPSVPGTPSIPGTPGVADLGAARRRRERTRRVLAVAAVVAAIALAVPVLGSLGRSSNDAETAGRFSSVGQSINSGDASSAESDAESDAGAAGGSDGVAADAQAPTSAAADAPATSLPPTASATGPALGALGEFADTATLVAAVRDLSVARAASGTTGDAAAFEAEPACAALLRGLAPPSVAVLTGTATLAGEPVVVLVAAPDDPALGQRVVVATADCGSVLDQQPVTG